jgi:hypothetical protein
MARKKKPEGETTDQARVRRAIETISNAASRSEKVSWDRKMDNMVKLLTTLRPIEEKIMDLMVQKQPIFDEIAALRGEMINGCVHPFTHLVFKQTDEGEVVQCKFCLRNFRAPTK